MIENIYNITPVGNIETKHEGFLFWRQPVYYVQNINIVEKYYNFADATLSSGLIKWIEKLESTNKK